MRGARAHTHSHLPNNAHPSTPTHPHPPANPTHPHPARARPHPHPRPPPPAARAPRARARPRALRNGLGKNGPNCGAGNTEVSQMVATRAPKALSAAVTVSRKAKPRHVFLWAKLHGESGFFKGCRPVPPTPFLESRLQDYCRQLVMVSSVQASVLSTHGVGLGCRLRSARYHESKVSYRGNPVHSARGLGGSRPSLAHATSSSKITHVQRTGSQASRVISANWLRRSPVDYLGNHSGPRGFEEGVFLYCGVGSLLYPRPYGG